MSRFLLSDRLLTASLVLLLNLFLLTAFACLLEILIPSLEEVVPFSLTKTFRPFEAIQNSSFFRLSK